MISPTNLRGKGQNDLRLYPRSKVVPNNEFVVDGLKFDPIFVLRAVGMVERLN